MNRIVDDDGKFTQEGTQRILEYIRALEDAYICCHKQNLQMEPSMYHLQATTMSEDLLLGPLQRGYPVALIACQSCGEVRNYNLQIIFGDFLVAGEQDEQLDANH